MNYSTDDFLYMMRLREAAFREIAGKLGKEHAITKMMGGRAWGRHPFETGPEPTLRKAIEGKASLDGAFDILNLWARDNDTAAQRVMLDLWPSGYRSSRSHDRAR